MRNRYIDLNLRLDEFDNDFTMAVGLYKALKELCHYQQQ